VSKKTGSTSISAMPCVIYFSIISKLLFLFDQIYDPDGGKSPFNIHVVVAEDVGLDKRIREEGIDENASYLHGFSSALELQATAGIPKVWIPVLGEGKEAQLTRIYDHVKPDEICPVIPSPSLDPRRGDNLLIEYRELLFDQLRVEPRNIIYASENNPFETYRQISQTVTHYVEALQSLDGCKAVISSVSSKLLSIGALLASFELKKNGYMVGISHVESQGYRMQPSDPGTTHEELYSLWLSGEIYES